MITSIILLVNAFSQRWWKPNGK